jgi:hypothetical protein
LEKVLWSCYCLLLCPHNNDSYSTCEFCWCQDIQFFSS